ncbi:MBL fold metallo-hydrolase [Geopsychrobacter electrodiphilus]|uniref:MBL fold metallo-hydrolase n=1 Tax=Geopsychrobacter electrodiphilus TaxID=225196 RepID=UPI00037BCDBB|nr:MBL fold metallo-hydrolase [Geopsychrobacter electrodiphilus]
MSMQLTILCDNSVASHPGLIGEHGFACHIATAGKQYLFDTGNGLGLLNNAKTCGIDLSQIDAILLSHGHWDHCGGLLPLLKLRAGLTTPIYAHPAIFEEKVNVTQGRKRDSGTGFTRSEAEAAGAVFMLSADPVVLCDGMLLSGEIPRPFPLEADKRLRHRQQGELVPDPLLDDQSLYLQTTSGLTILCGCAHAGVRNILNHAFALTGVTSLFGIVGGLHLMFTENEHQMLITNELQQHNIQLLAPSHCTGTYATGQLMHHFGQRVLPATVGTLIQL